MSGLGTIDALYLALAFLVPGFVLSAVRNQFITGQERQGTEQLVRFITYSAVNYAIFSVPIYYSLQSDVSALVKGALWGMVILIGPALLGAFSGAAIQKGWFRNIFHRLGLNPVHVVPTAWDYKFGSMRGGEWVLVSLKDGTEFAGFCGPCSFASSDSKERDLFVECLFELGEYNKWLPTTKSLYIASGEIRTIEFWPQTQESDDERQQSPQAPLRFGYIEEGISADQRVGDRSQEYSGGASTNQS